jgi:Transglutaminase-like superfamily
VGAAGSPRSPGPADEVGPQPQEGGPARARSQLQDRTQARIERLFRFVRDEIAHTFDLDAAALETRAAATVPGFPPAFVGRGIACRASEVLALGHGLCFAKSHLLAALLRFAGHPTGFCHVRLVDDERPGRFVLHGFVACFVPSRERWILLDPRGNRSDRDRPGERDAIESECRFEAPFSLAFVPDPARGESLLPLISKRPGKRIVELLERVPDLAALQRALPDRLD